MPTITRKIQLGFDYPKEELKEVYDRWYSYQNIVHKAANLVATHQFFQEKSKDFFYLTDEAKVKLENIAKDPKGILNTSRDNTTYQLLSKSFKGECYTGMLSALNTNVCKSFRAESKDIWSGKKSLRSYKRNIPMPIRKADTSAWLKLEDGNYSFFVYGTKFRTYFGKDLSDNQSIMDRAFTGDYKFCDSSIQLKGNKMFLLAVFSFEKEIYVPKIDNVAECYLDPIQPIIIKNGGRKKKGSDEKENFVIGDGLEHGYRIKAIRDSLRRVQITTKYSKGGRGRNRKLETIERFKGLEKNFTENRMHNYSRDLINYCLKREIGKIIFVNYEFSKEEVKDPKNKTLLQSWSYYNLGGKITYKAAIHGIVVEIKTIKTDARVIEEKDEKAKKTKKAKKYEHEEEVAI